jgi:hypothetical protein
LVEAVVEVACEGALDAPSCLPRCLSVCEQARVVGGGFGVVAGAGERDDVERAVELAVAAAVEPVALLAGAGGVDGAGAGEGGEAGFAVHAGGVAAGDHELGGADGADAALVQQLGDELLDARAEFGVELVRLGV